jgi:hypothetical protein
VLAGGKKRWKVLGVEITGDENMAAGRILDIPVNEKGK